MEVYIFQHIESSRLLPFTKKTHISVDASLTEKYIDNILIPVARYHNIDAQGLDVKKEKRICECLLYIEDTIYHTPLLRLNFRYGDQVFSPQPTNGIKRFIFRKHRKGEASYVISGELRILKRKQYSCYRMQDWKQSAIHTSNYPKMHRKKASTNG